jgi:uncharacterized protein YodC (DUF2158 family)
MHISIIICCVASSVYSSLAPEGAASDMILLERFSETRDNAEPIAGEFLGIRTLSEFSQGEIERLVELSREGADALAEKFSEFSEDIDKDDVIAELAVVLREFEGAHAAYEAFHENLLAHTDTFAVTPAEVSLVREFLTKFAMSQIGPVIQDVTTVLMTESDASRAVLCKWFKIGIKEFARQVQLYARNNGNERVWGTIARCSSNKRIFDTNAKACVDMDI